ncbi:MAG: hypothetical protein JKY91_05040 [Emcibacter sp.]|nr:hypothetical protein [Emcibacter sp.]
MKILFLGYGRTDSNLISRIEEKSCVSRIDHTTEIVTDFSAYDLVISYGYKHIISETCFSSMKRPALNLHLSYLPYNRGSDPNFWSFVENTPGGVTIHEINKGIDTGPVIYQKYVNFSEGENSFRATYDRLRSEVETLFMDNIDHILTGNYKVEKQRGFGSYHRKSDMMDDVGDWAMAITEYLEKYDQENHGTRAKLAIVDDIEKVRTNNNVNWMDLLRLAIKASPTDAKKLINRINSDDNKISKLFEQLGK